MNKRIRIVAFVGALVLYTAMIVRGVTGQTVIEVLNGVGVEATWQNQVEASEAMIGSERDIMNAIVLIIIAAGLVMNMESLRRRRHQVFLQKTEKDLSNMNKQELVAYVGELFKRMQYNVPLIQEEKKGKKNKEKEIDLLVRKGTKKAFCIECVVGDMKSNEVIEAFIEKTSKYKKVSKIVVTNATMNSMDIKYAKDRDVILIDRGNLLKMARQIEV